MTTRIGETPVEICERALNDFCQKVYEYEPADWSVVKQDLQLEIEFSVSIGKTKVTTWLHKKYFNDSKKAIFNHDAAERFSDKIEEIIASMVTECNAKFEGGK